MIILEIVQKLSNKKKKNSKKKNNQKIKIKLKNKMILNLFLIIIKKIKILILEISEALMTILAKIIIINNNKILGILENLIKKLTKINKKIKTKLLKVEIV